MTFIQKQHLQEIKSLESQVEYCNNAIKECNESWEVKEYKSVKNECLSKINSLKKLV